MVNTYGIYLYKVVKDELSFVFKRNCLIFIKKIIISYKNDDFGLMMTSASN